MLNAHLLTRCGQNTTCNSTQKSYYARLYSFWGLTYFKISNLDFLTIPMKYLPYVYSYDGFNSILIAISRTAFVDSFVFEESNNYFWDGLIDFDFPTKIRTYDNDADQYFRCEGLLLHSLSVLL